MDTAIEKMYHQIGREAVSVAEGLSGKLIVYAEVGNDIISADIFYINQQDTVRYVFSPDYLNDIIYEFWEKWKNSPKNFEWRTMCYVF